MSVGVNENHNLRNERIANAGLIAIAMVVGIHVGSEGTFGSAIWWWNTLTRCGMLQIAVPFFFVCSGYFLACRAEGWRASCIKRVRSLLVPYIIWSMIAALLSLGMAIAANAINERPLCMGVSVDWGRALGVNAFADPLLVPLWYIRALIIFVAIAPLILWVILRMKFCLVIVYLAWILQSASHGNPRCEVFLGHCLSMRGLFWFMIGCWIALYPERARGVQLTMRKWRWPMLLVGVLMVILSVCVDVELGYQSSALHPVFVPLLLAAFWSFVPSNRWPRTLTGATFAIYLVHPLVWLVLAPLHTLPVRGWFVGWLLKWGIGFFGAWTFSVLFSRISPRAAGVAFGGRLAK